MSNKKKVAEKMERKDQRKFGKILAKSMGQHKDPDEAEAHAERTMEAHASRERSMRKANSLAGKFKAGLAKREKEEPARIAALDKMFGVKR